MKSGLLILILAIFSITNLQANDSDICNIGGWASYTSILGDYALDSHPDVGVYGTHSFTPSLFVSGLLSYDPKFKKGRLQYGFLSYTNLFFKTPITFEGGLLRSSWGFWGDSMINPSTSPILLPDVAIYTNRYNTEILNRPGISVKFNIDKAKVRLFYGANNVIDKDEYIRTRYIQKDSKPNRSFGSLYSLGLTWDVGLFHQLNLEIDHSNLTKKANVNRNLTMLGYKYQKNKWIFSTEYLYQTATANLKVNAGHTAIFNEVFSYLAYDFEKVRVYSAMGYTSRNKVYAEYIGKASYSNIIKGLSKPSSNPLPGKLTQENHHSTSSLKLGMIWDINEEWQLRAEGTYVHAIGVDRLLNVDKNTVRNKNSYYFGTSLIYQF